MPSLQEQQEQQYTEAKEKLTASCAKVDSMNAQGSNLLNFGALSLLAAIPVSCRAPKAAMALGAAGTYAFHRGLWMFKAVSTEIQESSQEYVKNTTFS